MNIIKLWTLVLVLLLLTGCSSNGYRYVTNGTDSFISLEHSQSKENPENEMGSSAAPYVTFSSIEEMKKDIKQGTFTEEELKNILQFSKNSNGDITAPNVSRMAFTLPDSFELDDIFWSGGPQLTFRFARKNSSCIGNIECWTQKKLYEDWDLRYNSRDWAYNVTTEDVSGANGEIDGTACYFTNKAGEKWKDIQYEIHANDITYYVQEQYELAYSETDPNFIVIWCFGSDTAFMVTLTGDKLTQPTIDEITSFYLVS